MNTIRVTDFLNSKYAVSPENGDKMYDLIKSNLKNGDYVTISFQGIEQITTAFLNNAVAKLYNDFSPEELNTGLKIVDMESLDKYLLKKVIDRAKINLTKYKEIEDQIEGEFGHE